MAVSCATAVARPAVMARSIFGRLSTARYLWHSRLSNERSLQDSIQPLRYIYKGEEMNVARKKVRRLNYPRRDKL